MKDWFTKIKFALTAAAIAVCVFVPAGVKFLAGFPWSEKLFGGR